MGFISVHKKGSSFYFDFELEVVDESPMFKVSEKNESLEQIDSSSNQQGLSPVKVL